MGQKVLLTGPRVRFIALAALMGWSTVEYVLHVALFDANFEVGFCERR